MDDPISEVYVVIRERRHGVEPYIRDIVPKAFDTLNNAKRYCQEDAGTPLEWHEFGGPEGMGWRCYGITRYAIHKCPITSYGGDF
jgi:hypothetical protein